MNIRHIMALACTLAALASCDSTTESIGISITDHADDLAISTDTFTITTRSLLAGSVLSRNTTAYLGKVKDPETGAYITGDCMLQFHTLENFDFPQQDSIMSREDGLVIADSVDIRLFAAEFYGDSLAPMKMRVYEMDQPMEEGRNYYSDYDPYREGLVRAGGYHTDKTYTITDMGETEAVRNSNNYNRNIRVKLEGPYTDRDGKTYNNFGTYVLRKYYEDKTNFKNSYNFIHRVVPGFFVKTTGGLGAMAYVDKSQLSVYFRYQYNDSTYNGVSTFSGTEEVMQTTTITNDEGTTRRLAADRTCTYLKTPAGIFTEVTLPIDQIVAGRENDQLTSARISLTRLNNRVESDYALGTPQNLLILPKALMRSFFEQGQVPDYKSSFLASYTASTNSYAFGNLSGLISYMDGHRDAEDWNTAVVIPVTVTYVTTSSGASKISGVVHDMSLSSTRLVGGEANPYSPLKISVVYSRFK